MLPPGFEPGISRFVAECVIHCATEPKVLRGFLRSNTFIVQINNLNKCLIFDILCICVYVCVCVGGGKLFYCTHMDNTALCSRTPPHDTMQYCPTILHRVMWGGTWTECSIVRNFFACFSRNPSLTVKYEVFVMLNTEILVYSTIISI